MATITGLSGNDIYCLAKKGYKPGDIVVGNSVYSLGFLGTVSSGLKAIVGGEMRQVTELIEEGREAAYNRMMEEAHARQGTGITGVTSDLVFHNGNIEFLSIGSVVHAMDSRVASERFSTSADGKELYAQLDAGYKPICFAFGNVAYSLGAVRGIIGRLKTFARGEIREYSDMFNRTRHLALERIAKHAKENNANVVVGIKTVILPFIDIKEMLMLGTASYHPQFSKLFSGDVVTSDLTNQEMWSMAKLGYVPMRLLLGTSVFSLGLIGGFTSFVKSFVRGEITELTKMIYEARENALDIINKEAQSINADDVVGIKTFVSDLGNGLIEFLAVGTAVKKIAEVKTESDELPPQALCQEKNTFYSVGVNLNTQKT